MNNAFDLLPVIAAIDSYKTSHKDQYPADTTRIVSNFTPRASRINGINSVVWFGMQQFLLGYLQPSWRNFFSRNRSDIDVFEREIRLLLNDSDWSADHLRALHDLGYLPIEIKSLPEGSHVPLRVPVMTVHNTDSEFAWLTNYIETQISAQLWHPTTCATIAAAYRRCFQKYASLTGSPEEFIEFQGHDFSLRGQTSIASGAASGAGHLLSFLGSDTIPAIYLIREYYGPGDYEFIAGSVPAGEHSVVSASGTDETAFAKFLDAYPTGIFSYVSDTYDFWKFVCETLPKFKDKIMSRTGKCVIRPDSGDPVKILCGDPHADENSPEGKGLVRVLWDIFGGTTNDKGYKVLDPHIGCIYGDSITLDRQAAILSRLASDGFASCNVVLGIGSFSYQCVSRDTFGWAIKATYAEINGKGVPIYKYPKTDDGTKKSAKGLVFVNQEFQLEENVSWDKFTSDSNALRTVFCDGRVTVLENWQEIRTRNLTLCRQADIMNLTLCRQADIMPPARRLYHYDAADNYREGPNSAMTGDCSGLFGDCTGLSGDCSGLKGHCTDLTGDATGLTINLSDLPLDVSDLAQIVR